MSVKSRSMKGSRVASAASGLAAALRDRLRLAGSGALREAGMSTAEYAVGTVAACGFAAVLYKVVTSGSVSSEMRELIERALDAHF